MKQDRVPQSHALLRGGQARDLLRCRRGRYNSGIGLLRLVSRAPGRRSLRAGITGHGFVRALLAFVVGAALAVAVPLTASAAPAPSDTPTVAATPPMGWNDWYSFFCNLDEQLIEQTADAMVSSGMRDAGYQYVNLDDCWLSHNRDANGNLQPDPVKFPHGIKAVADYVHARGLKLGIYEDVGTATCAGYPGSYGHVQQDADTFASWGIDFVKVDWCNVPVRELPGPVPAGRGEEALHGIQPGFESHRTPHAVQHL